MVSSDVSARVRRMRWSVRVGANAERAVDRMRGDLAVLDRLDRQVAAAEAVAAGPDVRERGAAVGVDDDAAAAAASSRERRSGARTRSGRSPCSTVSAVDAPVLAGLDQLAVHVEHVRRSACRATWPPSVEHLSARASAGSSRRWLRPFLLVVRRRHAPLARAGRPSSRPRRRASAICTAASTAVMPPPITTTRRPTGSVGDVPRLAQLGDEVDRVAHAGRGLARRCRAR